MTGPSSKIVAKPKMLRACGHLQEFPHYEVDKYRAQRLAKFQKGRCADCVAKLMEEEQRAALLKPKKSEVLRSLPAGTKISLTRRPDGTWAGSLTADEVTVQATGVHDAGPESVVVALARAWSAKSGVV